jgi:hypothetical protein
VVGARACVRGVRGLQVQRCSQRKLLSQMTRAEGVPTKVYPQLERKFAWAIREWGNSGRTASSARTRAARAARRGHNIALAYPHLGAKRRARSATRCKAAELQLGTFEQCRIAPQPRGTAALHTVVIARNMWYGTRCSAKGALCARCMGFRRVSILLSDRCGRSERCSCFCTVAIHPPITLACLLRLRWSCARA